MKKVGKITRLFKTIKVKESEVAHSCPKARPFSYDLNQIPYNYTVEVTNRFTILDLMDRVPEELWREVHDTVQESVIKTIPKKKKSKKSKWLSEEALQIAMKRRDVKAKGEKERCTYLNAEFQRNSKERKESLPQ